MNKDEKVIFMISQDAPDNIPVVVLGIPTGAWDYMKDGRAHTFDLTKGGVPVKLVLFGCESHASGMQEIEKLAKQTDITVIDQRGKDFSI